MPTHVPFHPKILHCLTSTLVHQLKPHCYFPPQPANSRFLSGSCGVTNTDGDAIVALSHLLMNNPANPNNNPICNKQISIHNPTTGTDTIATVTDTCGACAFDDIDATISLFNKVAPNGDGRVHGIQWTPIGWTIPGSSGESESAANPSVAQASPPAAAAAPAAALPSVNVQEKVAAPAAPSAAPPTPSSSPAPQPSAPAAPPAASSATCTTAGEIICSADGTQIGTCTVELTVQMGPVASGTKCQNGYMVMANSRLRSRRT